jgi:hypothetical protein
MDYWSEHYARYYYYTSKPQKHLSLNVRKKAAVYYVSNEKNLKAMVEDINQRFGLFSINQLWVQSGGIGTTEALRELMSDKTHPLWQHVQKVKMTCVSVGTFSMKVLPDNFSEYIERVDKINRTAKKAKPATTHRSCQATFLPFRPWRTTMEYI